MRRCLDAFLLWLARRLGYKVMTNEAHANAVRQLNLVCLTTQRSGHLAELKKRRGATPRIIQKINNRTLSAIASLLIVEGHL